MFKVAFPDRLAFGDRTVENGLGESRFIAFVVTQAAITIHAHYDVALEFETKIHRQPDDLRHRFGVFPVHVKNRDLEHSPDVRRVGAGPSFAWTGGESYLVVDDDMESAADRVRRQLAEIESLLNHPFTRKSRVSVDEQGHAPPSRIVACPVLLGPGASQGHWVHELQVARVEA